jgi:putative ABC transport system substrate-binding protein
MRQSGIRQAPGICGEHRNDRQHHVGGAAVAWPFAVGAQQKAMPVVAYLNAFSPPPNLADLGRGPVHQGLVETGYVEGQNMTSEYRWAEDHYDRLPALAAYLVNRQVDLIITDRSNEHISFYT